MKLIEDCFQNEKGEWDISRIAWAALIVAFICNAAWAVFTSHQFSAQDFGIGAAALLAGGGAGTMWHGKAP